nr:hypothetical protein [Tanacetum cinerariifolium]
MEDLLQPRHPLDKYHQSQLAALAALPEEQRAEHARLFRLGNASYRYQQQAVGEITETDYLDWLEGLPAKMRRVVKQEGFEQSKSNLALRRHALERRDIGYDAFMQALLSPEDWAYQQQYRMRPLILEYAEEPQLSGNDYSNLLAYSNSLNLTVIKETGEPAISLSHMETETFTKTMHEDSDTDQNMQLENLRRYTDTATETRVHNEVSDGDPDGFRMAIEHIERFTAVWFRRVKKPVLTLEDAYTSEYISSELIALLNNFYYLLDCKWVSKPEHIYKAENKLYNLKVATGLGFIIPETIISNQKQTITDFFHRHEGEIIIKPIFNNKLLHSNHKQVIFTSKVKREHIDQLDQFHITPSIFQCNIPKAYEVRVTIVGQHIFAAAVDSQAHEATKQDWRKEKLLFTPYTLPEDIAEKCLSLVSALNLNFGAIDLIKSTDGQYYFLEINPNGQWAWMEMDCGLPISSALIHELTD